MDLKWLFISWAVIMVALIGGQAYEKAKIATAEAQAQAQCFQNMPADKKSECLQIK